MTSTYAAHTRDLDVAATTARIDSIERRTPAMFAAQLAPRLADLRRRVASIASEPRVISSAVLTSLETQIAQIEAGLAKLGV